MLFLISCNLNTVYTNDLSDKAEAEEIAEQLYNHLEKGNLQEAQNLFSDKFFNVTPPDSLNSMFLRIKNLGKYKNRTLKDWKTLRVAGSKPKAEYMLLYNVNYTSYSAQETLRMEKEGKKIMIVGYQVYSDGF